MPRLLDLFCGAGGCSVGYHRAGFTEIVGVDNRPMPRYPFAFVQGDALEYLAEHGSKFHAIHASPPCQAYCSLRFLPNAKSHPDLVDPTRAALVATGKLWVIENVIGAPLRNPTMLCGTMFGLGTGSSELRRHRLFETNWLLKVPFGMFCKHGRRGGDEPDCVGLYGSEGRARSTKEIVRRRPKTICVIGGHGDPGISHARRAKKAKTVGVWGHAGGESKRDGLLYFSTAERNEAMGIDWMKGSEISQAIPPAYTEFIGKQLLERINDAN